MSTRNQYLPNITKCTIHQSHIFTKYTYITKHISILWLISTLCNAPRHDTWYQITSEVVTPDANWTSLSTAIISTAIWIQVFGQRQYGCKHPTQHMMHEHMTQSTMHIFITIQRLYSTAISTIINGNFNGYNERQFQRL